MKTDEITKNVAEKLGQTQVQTRKEIDALINILSDELAKGKAYSFPNFLTIFSKEKEARKSYNPSSGEYMMVPKRRTLGINVSDNFKDRIKALKFD